MKLKQRIYCIGGVWDYARRDCATIPELKHYLTHEWRRCKVGSVLYLATHGDQGEIYLSEGERLGLDTLAGLLEEGQCKDRLVHFSGCGVLGGD